MIVILKSVIYFIVCIQNGFSFTKDPDSSFLFRDFINYFEFKSVNIYTTRDPDIGYMGWHRFLSSLTIPFLFMEYDSDRAIKIDLPSSVLAIASMDTPASLQLLEKIGQKNLFSTNHWVIVGDPSLLSNRRGHSPYFPLDNKVFFAKWPNSLANNTSNRLTKINLMETYQASPYLPYIVNPLGSWTRKGGLMINVGEPAMRRTNLTGLHFRCVTLDQVPFTYLEDGALGKETKLVKGFVKDVWDSLQNVFNFKYTCKRPNDKEWGGLRDGQWTGLVREIVDNSADVVVASLDFTSERAQVVDFMQGLRTVGYKMVVRRPGLLESTWTSFTSELRMESWIATVGMIFSIPLCLAFVSHYSPYEEWKIPYQDAYVLTLGALFFQGSWINVSSTSTRMVFITIFLATLLVYAHYTSALVAQLTVSSDVSTAFSTLQGLLDDGGYNLGFKKGTSLEENFKTSTTTPFKELWNNIIIKDEANLPAEHRTGLMKVKKEKYIYLMEENLLKFEFFTESDVMTMSNEYFSSPTGIAFRKKSHYVKTFNYQLNKLRDSGILERYWKKWQPPVSLCAVEAFVALSINQTFTAFLALLLGLIIATLFCLPLERIYSPSTKSGAGECTAEELQNKTFGRSFQYPLDRHRRQDLF